MSILNDIYSFFFPETQKDMRSRITVFEIPHNEAKTIIVNVPANIKSTYFNIREWNVNVGDIIKEGQLLCELETDKFTMEFESFQSGKLVQITRNTENLKVGDLICKIEMNN